MQDKLVYLESDEEITTVIDKISKVPGDEVALVIPRGGNIGQSIVNLKLIKKRSNDLGKDVALVTTDKISRNLASQVGISVYSKVEEVGRRKIAPAPIITPDEPITNTDTIKSDVPAPEAKRPAEDLPELPGIRINRYYDEKSRSEVKPTVEEPKVKEPEPELPKENITFEEAGANNISNIDNKKSEEETLTGQEEKLEEIESEEKVDRKSDFSRRDLTIGQAQIEHQKAQEMEPVKTEKISPPAGKEEEEKKNKLPGRRFKSSRKRKLIFVAVAVFLLLCIGAGYLILPQAKVTIVFSANSFLKEAEVSVSKNIESVDPEKLAVPATQSVVEKEISEKIPATGKKNIGNKATGEITFYNYIELSSQKIPAGSQLTASGKKFVTDTEITIPAVTVVSVIPFASNPGTVKGKVTAIDPGAESNLPANTKFTFNSFSGNKQNNIYGQNSAALAGGDTKEVAVVSAGDLSGAQEKITNRLKTEAKDEVLKKIPSTEKFIEGTSVEQLSELKGSVPANTQANDFTFSGKIKLTILSFKEDLLREMLVQKFEKDIENNRVLVQKENIKLDYSIISKTESLDSIVYKINLEGKVSSKIDENQLREQLRGNTKEKASEMINSLDLVKEANVDMFPNLKIYPTLPLFGKSIKIVTSYSVE